MSYWQNVTASFNGGGIPALEQLLPVITTHRIKDEPGNNSASISSYFPKEALLAAIAVAFCRLTISTTPKKTRAATLWYHKAVASIWWRVGFALGLAALAYERETYWIICAVELFSYILPWLVASMLGREDGKTKGSQNGSFVANPYRSKKGKTATDAAAAAAAAGAGADVLKFILLIAISAGASVGLCYTLASHGWRVCFTTVYSVLPSQLQQGLHFLFPIEEVHEAYQTILQFSDESIVEAQMRQLLFITFHIQVGMGFLGIAFLTREQMRRNELIRLEEAQQREEGATSNGKKKAKGASPTKKGKAGDDAITMRAKRFRWGAVPFIFGAAIPYMMQLIVMGGLNEFSYTCFRDDLKSAVRLERLFGSGEDEYNSQHLVALSQHATLSPGMAASSMDTVVSTVYDLVNRKLFSLPKLLLIPSIMAREPHLILHTFPFIVVADKFKAWVVASMTSEIQRLDKRQKDLRTVRTKLESFDVKNADILQRSGGSAIAFTKKRWLRMTREIQSLQVTHSLLKRSKLYFSWLQRNFVIMALVDGALAMLIAAGRITSADVFVFARAMEDAIDLILMRSRAESELASMMTDIEKLRELIQVWETSREERKLLDCRVDAAGSAIQISNLAYARGTASVRVDSMSIEPGIYALTGANGSGKSSLFRVLLACSTNAHPIDLPPSIHLNSTDLEGRSIVMPSSDMVEIGQSFYWPLHTRPVDWIYQDDVSEMSALERDRLVARVEEQLHQLDFKRDHGVTNATTNVPLHDDLLEEKEDWFTELSGGQKCKVELVRKVFLAESCPSILLIDETLAPLDPSSKRLVMQRLQQFCRQSIVLVIYHNDVSSIAEADNEEHFDDDVAQYCVPSHDFFDDNLHVENGVLTRRSLCV